jgi:alpha-1,3-rhamnosyl/mannosyltransferase
VAKSVARVGARVCFAAYSRTRPFDLYHEPNFLPYPCRKPTVVTVHDLSVWLHPEWHPSDRVSQHRKRFAQGLRRADHILVVSDTVRNDVLREFDLSPSKVTRVYNGISGDFRIFDAEVLQAARVQWNLPPRYFLAVGSVEPRKNLLTALRAYVDLPEAVRQDCPFVLAGPWGWKSEDVRHFFETQGSQKGIIRLGYVPDEDLPKVYAGATALVFPTLYEGFGLPPLEMLAVGGRVLVSDLPITREILKSHATYLPCLDVNAWREAMRVVSEQSPVVNMAASRYAREFTWQNTVTETLAVYRATLGLGQPSRLAA